MSQPPNDPRSRRHWRITRDAVLFTVGLLGVAHETLVYQGERPSLLILFAAMMGLPLVLRRNGL